ncbi:MAG: asparagine--tRNA ligase, partial [Tenericutes bacterium]|nr:asparagine--tRNA ligase [Mycoplasmatota bacterium]
MEITIRELMSSQKKLEGKEVTIKGWVRNNRDQKSFGFIDLNDGTCFESLQIVYEDQTLENYKEVAKFRVGSSIEATGVIVLTPKAKQQFEVKATNINLLGDSLEDYPIQPKRHTREFLRENAHLRMRTNLYNSVFRVRSVISHAIHKFFQDRNFIYVHTPIITTSDAEGAGEMFQVTTLDMNEEVDYSKDFFGKKANLSVSGQLQAEAYALAFKNVYTFAPTFRAENSNTKIHASEFWMIEPEIAFADLNDDMDLAEDMVKYIINDVFKRCPSEMNFFDRFVEKGLKAKLEKVLNSKFKVVTHKEAI